MIVGWWATPSVVLILCTLFVLVTGLANSTTCGAPLLEKLHIESLKLENYFSLPRVSLSEDWPDGGLNEGPCA